MAVWSARPAELTIRLGRHLALPDCCTKTIKAAVGHRSKDDNAAHQDFSSRSGGSGQPNRFADPTV